MKWENNFLVWLFIAALLLCLSYFAHSDGGYITIPIETYQTLQTDFEVLTLQFSVFKMALVDLLKYPGLIEQLISQYEESLNDQKKITENLNEQTTILETSTAEEEQILNDASDSLTTVKKYLTDSIKIIEHSGRNQLLKEIGIGIGCFIGGILTKILIDYLRGA